MHSKATSNIHLYVHLCWSPYTCIQCHFASVQLTSTSVMPPQYRIRKFSRCLVISLGANQKLLLLPSFYIEGPCFSKIISVAILQKQKLNYQDYITNKEFSRCVTEGGCNKTIVRLISTIKYSVCPKETERGVATSNFICVATPSLIVYTNACTSMCMCV